MITPEILVVVIKNENEPNLNYAQALKCENWSQSDKKTVKCDFPKLYQVPILIGENLDFLKAITSLKLKIGDKYIEIKALFATKDKVESQESNSQYFRYLLLDSNLEFHKINVDTDLYEEVSHLETLVVPTSLTESDTRLSISIWYSKYNRSTSSTSLSRIVVESLEKNDIKFTDYSNSELNPGSNVPSKDFNTWQFLRMGEQFNTFRIVNLSENSKQILVSKVTIDTQNKIEKAGTGLVSIADLNEIDWDSSK